MLVHRTPSVRLTPATSLGREAIEHSSVGFAATFPQGKAQFHASGNEAKPSPLGKVPRNEADEVVKTLASNLILSIKQ